MLGWCSGVAYRPCGICRLVLYNKQQLIPEKINHMYKHRLAFFTLPLLVPHADYISGGALHWDAQVEVDPSEDPQKPTEMYHPELTRFTCNFFCQLQANFTWIPPYRWVQGLDFPRFWHIHMKNARKMPQNSIFTLHNWSTHKCI